MNSDRAVAAGLSAAMLGAVLLWFGWCGLKGYDNSAECNTNVRVAYCLPGQYT